MKRVSTNPFDHMTFFLSPPVFLVGLDVQSVKKKRSNFIIFNTNYRREKKLVPDNMDDQHYIFLRQSEKLRCVSVNTLKLGIKLRILEEKIFFKVLKQR